MKKSIFLLLVITFLSNCLYAQLEVNDTLLMAQKYDIYWGESSELELTDYADFGKYGSVNLGDNDSTTCWAEGSKSDGTGEFVLMTIPDNIKSLKIRNGYQKNETIYYANNRPKDLELTLYASYEPSGFVTETHTGFFISEPLIKTQATLKDKPGYQQIETGFNWNNINEEMSHDNTFDKDRFILKIKILDVYKGNKWNDACISDIKAIASPYLSVSSDEHGFVKIYEDRTDTLFYNPEDIYQVVEISSNLEWIIFIVMPSDIGDSRVETIYKLYNTIKEQFIDIKNVYEMYDFEEKEGKLYLKGTDNDMKDISVCLDEL